MSKNILFCVLFICCFTCPLFAYNLVVITMFRNEAPYLKEWIEYHRLIGVDHFFLYNDGSTDDFQNALQPYIDAGIVECQTVKSDSQKYTTPAETFAAYVKRQCAAYKDGLQKSKGYTTWAALIDVDEFLLPLRNSTITECLQTHFSHASGIYVNWRNFGTSNVYVPEDEPFLFHLTKCSMKGHPRNIVGKSIVRPEQVRIDDIWYPHHMPLQSGAYYYNGDSEIIQNEDGDIKTDAKHHDKYLRINHYVLRDQGYYERVKRPRATHWYGDKELLLEHYEAFSLIPDKKIIDLIQKHYPLMYEKIWKNHSR